MVAGWEVRNFSTLNKLGSNKTYPVAALGALMAKKQAQDPATVNTVEDNPAQP